MGVNAVYVIWMEEEMERNEDKMDLVEKWRLAFDLKGSRLKCSSKNPRDSLFFNVGVLR